MRAKQFALGMAIAILLPVVVHYGVELIAPSPYPTATAIAGVLSDREAAVSRWAAPLSGHAPAPSDDWQHHDEVHFAVAYLAGLAAIAFGTMIRVPSVGAGLMFGGLFTFINGCLFTWGAIEDRTRFVALVIALLLFISLGLWKLGGVDKPPAGGGGDDAF